MSTFSSYRIGSRASEDNNYSSTSESNVLRSLFELRKSNNHQSDDDIIQHLTFWNCEWSPRIIQSLRKILVRDERRFASIKFFDCAIQNDKKNSEFFEEILRIVLVNNSTQSLVIKGGRLIGNSNAQEQESQSYCPLSCPCTSITNALQEELPSNTSLASLKLSSLDFSSSSTVEALSNAVSQNETLASISLRQCSLDDESIAQILKSLKEHPNLSCLDLSKNFLGARKSNATFSSTMALDSVAELLRSTTTKLEHFNLSSQYQQHPIRSAITQPLTEIDQEQIQHHRAAFAKALDALSTNHILKSIDLSQNPGCLLDISSVNALSACLSNNNCLESVNISDCGMTAENISHLATECLPFCGKSLKSLVLFGSRAKAASPGKLQNSPCESIATNTGAHTDDYFVDSADALEKGVLSNMTLENLGELPCEIKTYQRIQHTLNLNKGGRRAFRSSLPPAVWSNIFARAGSLDYERATGVSVVFSLLRQGPALMEH